MVKRLLESGLARPDPLKLGFDVDEAGRLIAMDGSPQDDLFGVGPITRGALWEIVAAPDIRLAAQSLAETIAAKAHAPTTA